MNRRLSGAAARTGGRKEKEQKEVYENKKRGDSYKRMGNELVGREYIYIMLREFSRQKVQGAV